MNNVLITSAGMRVGDNPKKDFFVTSDLGWLSIGADWVKNKVHKYTEEDLIKFPDHWIKKPFDLIQYITINHSKSI